MGTHARPKMHCGASSRASSKYKDKEFAWSGGWTVRTRKGAIINTAEHYAWKRELNCFEGQHLPEALFGHSLVELRHSSGFRLRFTALEALRSWASLDLPPVRVPAAKSWSKVGAQVHRYDYDYTFTTAHPGAVDIASSGVWEPATQPNSSSFVCRPAGPAVDRATGNAQLRKPLCKCKGEGGRTPFLKPPALQRPSSIPPDAALSVHQMPPRWEPTKSETVDIEALIKSAPVPLFWDSVELYEDDLHENGHMFLRVRVYVADGFWVCYQRFFVKVTDVLGRVIDTRYQYIKGDRHVLREQTFKEGRWEQMIHERADMDEGISDHLAAQRLPLTRDVVTERLSLVHLKRPLPMKASLTWQHSVQSCDTQCMCASRSARKIVLLTGGGTLVKCLDSQSGEPVWEQGCPNGTREMLTIACSPNGGSDIRLAVGDDQGLVHIWDLVTGQVVTIIPVAPVDPRQQRNVSSTKNWVEKVAWSYDGEFVGAAAGRCSIIAAANTGEVVASSVAEQGTITAIAFMPNQVATLAIGTYGGVRWLVGNDEPLPPPLDRGAAAVLSVGISPDATRIAVGFLDKKLRVCVNGVDPADWVGFNAPVSRVAWSASGKWLASLGGSTILVVPSDLAPGFESPILFRTIGTTVADGCGGTCSRFTSLVWCSVDGFEHLCAATEASNGKVHLFDASSYSHQSPHISHPIFTITPRGNCATAEVTFDKHGDTLIVLIAEVSGEVCAWAVETDNIPCNT